MELKIEFKDKKAVERIIRKNGERAKEVVINRLMQIGEECVNVARNLPSPDESFMTKLVPGKKKPQIKKYNPHQPHYIDHTGNLRHSIGYLVAVDGKIIKADFENTEGSKTATDALANYNQGIVLIMVAGMKYAYYVSKKGYDVLDSAIIEMKKKFQEFVDLINNV